MKQAEKEEARRAAWVSGRSPGSKEAQGEGDREGTSADIVSLKDQKVSTASGEKHQPPRIQRERFIGIREEIPPFENDRLLVTEVLFLSN